MFLLHKELLKRPWGKPVYWLLCFVGWFSYAPFTFLLGVVLIFPMAALQVLVAGQSAPFIGSFLKPLMIVIEGIVNYIFKRLFILLGLMGKGSATSIWTRHFSLFSLPFLLIIAPIRKIWPNNSTFYFSILSLIFSTTIIGHLQSGYQFAQMFPDIMRASQGQPTQTYQFETNDAQPPRTDIPTVTQLPPGSTPDGVSPFKAGVYEGGRDSRHIVAVRGDRVCLDISWGNNFSSSGVFSLSREPFNNGSYGTGNYGNGSAWRPIDGKTLEYTDRASEITLEKDPENVEQYITDNQYFQDCLASSGEYSQMRLEQASDPTFQQPQSQQNAKDNSNFSRGSAPQQTRPFVSGEYESGGRDEVITAVEGDRVCVLVRPDSVVSLEVQPTEEGFNAAADLSYDLAFKQLTNNMLQFVDGDNYITMTKSDRDISDVIGENLLIQECLNSGSVYPTGL